MMENFCTNENYINKGNLEIVQIQKVKHVCSLCENYAEHQLQNKIPLAILSCERACLRGEVSRRVANNICFKEIPEKTSRICLGGAFTKNTGQRKLVRDAQLAICLEGCSIKCASRMMKGVIEDLDAEVIYVDRYYDFNTSLFGINEVSEKEIENYAKQATEKIMKKIKT